MPSINWSNATVPAHEWVYRADETYIAARVLYAGYVFASFTTLASHAFELYAKAYLIDRTGQFPRIHDLTKICKLGANHDPFFDHLVRTPNFSTSWGSYIGLFRYPESLPNTARPGSAAFIHGNGGTIEQLDRLARFVRSQVPYPDGHQNPIADLLRLERGSFIIGSEHKALTYFMAHLA